jgi:hypothetical protein
MHLPHLYVAGPMTGRPKFNYPTFTLAALALRNVGFTVTSPHELDEDLLPEFDPTDPSTLKPGDYERVLEEDLSLISSGEIEGIATLPGWERSGGARREVAQGRFVGIPILPVPTWWLHGRSVGAYRARYALGLPA